MIPGTALLLSAALGLGCPQPRGPAAQPPPDPAASIDEASALVRASMALRGIRPSPGELEQIRSEPGALSEIVHGYLNDPRFGETIRDLHADHLHLRWPVQPSAHPRPEGIFEGEQVNALAQQIDEAPLRLIEWIVMGRRPYTEVVTSEVAMASWATAPLYGLSFDPLGEPWQPSRWADGRPAAGVLSSNGFLQRYHNGGSNHHRSRAAAAAATFVCDDIARRPGLEINIFDPGRSVDAVHADPACLGCHATLDPIASTFFDFRDRIFTFESDLAGAQGCEGPLAYACPPWVLWAPDPDGRRDAGMPEPAFYGTPVADVGELGQQIAADPRFATCTAERFWAWLSQTDPADAPPQIVAELAQDFVDSGHDAAELAAAVVLHPAFDRLLVARPNQYARLIEDLTGYTWTGSTDAPGCDPCGGPFDLARDAHQGMHATLGGTDGWYILQPTLEPTPAQALARAWLAEEAAAHVVAHDLAAAPADRLLLVAADPHDPSPEAIEAQLAHLHRRILAEEAPDPTATRALLEGAQRPDDPAAGWVLVITALLLDNQVVMY